MIDLSINPEEVSIVLKEFIKTYVENSGSTSVILGLSGGVDSAVSAVLCKGALGVNNVQCVFLPDETTSSLDREHVNLIVKTFHVRCKEIDISPFAESFHCALKPKKKMTLANIKSG